MSQSRAPNDCLSTLSGAPPALALTFAEGAKPAAHLQEQLTELRLRQYLIGTLKGRVKKSLPEHPRRRP